MLSFVNNMSIKNSVTDVKNGVRVAKYKCNHKTSVYLVKKLNTQVAYITITLITNVFNIIKYSITISIWVM